MEPVATAVHCVKRARIHPMENVTIIGMGTMGILNAQVAKAFGARVIMSDISPKKIQRAKEMGIGEVIDAADSNPVEKVKRLTDGVGSDVVIVAVANTEAYRQAYQMVKYHRGRILFFAGGYPKPEFAVDPNDLHYRKAELIGTVDADAVDFVDSSRLLSNQLIHVRYALEGKSFDLKDFNAALEAAATHDSYRITVRL